MSRWGRGSSDSEENDVVFAAERASTGSSVIHKLLTRASSKLGLTSNSNRANPDINPYQTIPAVNDTRDRYGSYSSSVSMEEAPKGSIRNVLFVGCGDSGKTKGLTYIQAFQRQLRKAYHGDPNDQERCAAACIIIHHLIWGVESILECLAEKLERPTPAALEESIRALNSNTFGDFQQTSLTPSLHTAMVEIASSDYFQDGLKIIKDQHLVDIPDAFYSFVDKLCTEPSWGIHDWLPTDDEIISQYVRTSGIISSDLAVGDRTVALFDTGGQRCERRKWQYAFEQADAVVFVASLAEYNQTLYEDPSRNRLEESISVFRELLNHPNLQHAQFHLILNKRDEFIHKFVNQRIPVRVSGRFSGAPVAQDPNLMIDWIKSRFCTTLAARIASTHVISALMQDEVCGAFDVIVRNESDDGAQMTVNNSDSVEESLKPVEVA